MTFDPHDYDTPEKIIGGHTVYHGGPVYRPEGLAPGVSARIPANFDPPDFWQGSDLERMVTAAEEATDLFVRAVDKHSEAEAAYLKVFHAVRAERATFESSVAAAERAAEDAAVKEKIAEKFAEGAMISAKALMQTRLAVLSAAQTHARMIERQT